MGLKLSECSPLLRDKILAQLAKEDRHLPTVGTMYAAATFANRKWHVGPETENLKLICSIVGKLQRQNGHTAYQASIGKPLAVVLRLTRTTPATHPKEIK